MGSMITSAGPGVGLVQRLDGRLVGRVRERRLLDGLIESVEGGGAAAVIVGEAGVGKTALLMHVADVASKRGLRVLRARGEESEAVLAFATLADLLLPLREKFARAAADPASGPGGVPGSVQRARGWPAGGVRGGAGGTRERRGRAAPGGSG